MADAPVYGSPRVAPAPISQPRQSPNAPTTAFGVGKSVNLGGVANEVNDFVTRQQDAADQLAINMHSVALGDIRTDLMTHASSAKGINALQAADEVKEAWEKHTAKLIDSLPNERIKQAVSQRAQGMWAVLHEVTETHAAAELTKADAATTDALLQQQLQSVEHDPTNAPQAIEHTAATIRDYGKRVGWTPDVIDQKVRTAASNIHASAISKMIEINTDLTTNMARDYLSIYRDELVGQQLSDAIAHVDGATTEQEGLQAARSLLDPQQGTPPATEAEALARLDGLGLGGKQLAAAQRKVEQFWAAKRRSESDKQKANYQTIGDALAKTGRIPRSSPAWTTPGALSPPERASLEAAERQKLHPPPDLGDEDEYLHQVYTATVSPETRKQFVATDVMTILGLNTRQRTSLMALQRQFSAQEEKANVRDPVRAEQLRYDRETALRKAMDPTTDLAKDKVKQAEEVKAINAHYDALEKAYFPPAPAVTPVKSVLPPRQPTAQELEEASQSPGYAAFLRDNNVQLPKVLPTHKKAP